jgi:hypothetical protein
LGKTESDHPANGGGADERKARLARALRDNLRRRKAQQRGRAAPAEPGSGAAPLADEAAAAVPGSGRNPGKK